MKIVLATAMLVSFPAAATPEAQRRRDEYLSRRATIAARLSGGTGGRRR